jgi:deoxyribonuclease V
MKMAKMMQKRFLNVCRTKDYEAAVAFQNKLVGFISGKCNMTRLNTICSPDISYNKFSPRMYGAAAPYFISDLPLIDKVVGMNRTEFPYVTGLPAFREGPPLLGVLAKLSSRQDLLIFEDQGQLHLRKEGVASMRGLLSQLPLIGSAKTRIIGSYTRPAQTKGSISIIP